ncbi:hypothetical protein ACFSUK_23595 [Sphingobium scionense]
MPPRAGGAPEAPAAEKSAPEPPRSPDARRVIDWIAATGDNHGLPYAIVDKQAAHVFLFDAKGKALADAPVLIGIAPGDDATPGVGKKSLAEIGPAEKTTPVPLPRQIRPRGGQATRAVGRLCDLGRDAHHPQGQSQGKATRAHAVADDRR